GTATASGRRIIPQTYATNVTTSTGSITYDDCSVFAGQPATTPDAPAGLNAVAGVGQVALDWQAPVSHGGSPITDYMIQYSVDGSGSWTTFNDGISASTTAVVSGLTNGVAYRFRIAAVNNVGTGAYSPASEPATPTPPPPT